MYYIYIHYKNNRKNNRKRGSPRQRKKTNETNDKIIENLPRGQILGIAIFSDTFWFDKKNLEDKWCYGPFCYNILDVFRLKKGIDIKGHLKLWKPSEEIHQKIMMEQISVKNKISEWLKQFGDKLSDVFIFKCNAYSHHVYISGTKKKKKNIK